MNSGAVKFEENVQNNLNEKKLFIEEAKMENKINLKENFLLKFISFYVVQNDYKYRNMKVNKIYFYNFL